MISVGIDVSKEKSTVCIMKPYGEVVCSPFEVKHLEEDLGALGALLHRLDGEIKIVMEATGIYHLPILTFLHEKGYFISVVNPYAMKKYAKDYSIRGAKTDKLDSMMIANYGIDKWFKIDKNRDGFASNIEMESWNTFNMNGKTLEGVMSNEELSKKYNMNEKILEDMQSWLDGEIESLKSEAKNMYGVELSSKQIIELKKEQIKQLNTWLMKEGDNQESSFYQQLNLDAYTRLMSTVDNEACCGGDICEFSNFSPSNLEKNGKYTAEEMKARLAWAENSYLVDDNGKTVYDENGQTIPAKMMTAKQVEMYKEIVESVTGKPWDSDGWEVTAEQWNTICEKVNGTEGDEERLNGKTRADIPENRQALLRFLEEKGWLYEQFK